MRARYTYGGQTLASFIELAPRFLRALNKDDVIDKFRHALQAVPGVSQTYSCGIVLAHQSSGR